MSHGSKSVSSRSNIASSRSNIASSRSKRLRNTNNNNNGRTVKRTDLDEKNKTQTKYTKQTNQIPEWIQPGLVRWMSEFVVAKNIGFGVYMWDSRQWTCPEKLDDQDLESILQFSKARLESKPNERPIAFLGTPKEQTNLFHEIMRMPSDRWMQSDVGELLFLFPIQDTYLSMSTAPNKRELLEKMFASLPSQWWQTCKNDVLEFLFAGHNFKRDVPLDFTTELQMRDFIPLLHPQILFKMAGQHNTENKENDFPHGFRLFARKLLRVQDGLENDDSLKKDPKIPVWVKPNRAFQLDKYHIIGDVEKLTTLNRIKYEKYPIWDMRDFRISDNVDDMDLNSINRFLDAFSPSDVLHWLGPDHYHYVILDKVKQLSDARWIKPDVGEFITRLVRSCIVDTPADFIEAVYPVLTAPKNRERFDLFGDDFKRDDDGVVAPEFFQVFRFMGTGNESVINSQRFLDLAIDVVDLMHPSIMERLANETHEDKKNDNRDVQKQIQKIRSTLQRVAQVHMFISDSAVQTQMEEVGRYTIPEWIKSQEVKWLGSYVVVKKRVLLTSRLKLDDVLSIWNAKNFVFTDETDLKSIVRFAEARLYSHPTDESVSFLGSDSKSLLQIIYNMPRIRWMKQDVGELLPYLNNVARDHNMEIISILPQHRQELKETNWVVFSSFTFLGYVDEFAHQHFTNDEIQYEIELAKFLPFLHTARLEALINTEVENTYNDYLRPFALKEIEKRETAAARRVATHYLTQLDPHRIYSTSNRTFGQRPHFTPNVFQNVLKLAGVAPIKSKFQ